MGLSGYTVYNVVYMYIYTYIHANRKLNIEKTSPRRRHIDLVVAKVGGIPEPNDLMSA